MDAVLKNYYQVLARLDTVLEYRLMKITKGEHLDI